MRKGADKIPGKRIAPPYNPPPQRGEAIALLAEGGTGGELLFVSVMSEANRIHLPPMGLRGA